MIRGQIASSEVVGASYAEDIKSLWGLRERLCSKAYPGYRNTKIYPEACRACGHCAYGKRLLELIEKGMIKV